MTETLWKPLDLSGEQLLNFKKYSLVVLNTPILLRQDHVIRIWKEASFRIVADGGINRWLKFCETIPDHYLPEKYPHILSGDLDSATEENIHKARENGVTVIHTPDQDKTDFTKALELVAEKQDSEIDTVIVLVENYGRLDQIMSNLDTLYKIDHIFTKHHINIYLLASNTLTWLLQPGHHRIQVPEILVKQKACCSLLPLGRASNVTTKGLMWNLDNRRCEFGLCVSSSNTYVASDVTVTTDENIVWSMCLNLDS